jgi:aspartyl-tRNA(Asn)/glutamyl-tRNA(Gln) amidotransferase subunit A
MTDPADLAAADLVELFRAKTLSPLEAVRAVLKRIDATAAEFNAFRLVDAEGALAQARDAEARWQRGAPLGSLDGVPVAFKDLLDVRGWPTRRGSLATSEKPVDEDAPAAARLREVGAVFLGKTNTAEFGWKSVTESALAGITRNPWNPEHTPTGSSGGAGTAAALGLGPLHVATDGGGSIRVPASACGVFGLKPSYGRVPGYPPAYNGTLFHVGPIARTVTDAALLLNVISGYDARDWTSLPPDGRDFCAGLDDGVRGLRIAYSRTLGYVKVTALLLSVVDAAVETFSDLGADVEPVDPGFADPRPILDVFAAERAARLRADIPPDRHRLIDPDLWEGGAARPAVLASRLRGGHRRAHAVGHSHATLSRTLRLTAHPDDGGIRAQDRRAIRELARRTIQPDAAARRLGPLRIRRSRASGRLADRGAAARGRPRSPRSARLRVGASVPHATALGREGIDGREVNRSRADRSATLLPPAPRRCGRCERVDLAHLVPVDQIAGDEIARLDAPRVAHGERRGLDRMPDRTPDVDDGEATATTLLRLLGGQVVAHAARPGDTDVWSLCTRLTGSRTPSSVCPA